MEATDPIDTVNNAYLIPKLKSALEYLRRNGAKEELVRRLWTKDVIAYIKTILPQTGDKVKKLWNAKLEDIKSLDKNERRKELASKTMHQSGKTFNPVNIMCLFIFGLVNFGEEGNFKFTALLNKKDDEKERTYIANFLSFILLEKSEQEMKVYSSDFPMGESLETKIHDKLFITSDNHPFKDKTIVLDFIPENPWMNFKESLDNELTITSDPAFWYVYIVYDLKKDLKCTGLLHKNNYYVFAHNLPKYGNQPDTDLKTLFIDNPLNAYKQVMNAPFPSMKSVMSKVPQDYPMLVYVHVLLAAMYHHDKDFYVCKQHSADEEILKTALWAGANVTEYQDKLIHLPGSLTALVLDRSLADEDVLIRLATAHYELMSKSTMRFDIDNGAVAFHKTFSPATCEVEDGWVFGELILKKSEKWREELQKLNRAARTADDTSALRRILCYIPEGSAYCKELCEKYKRKINLGCKVNVNAHVVFDFMQHAIHNKLLSKTGVTFRDYCASDRYERITNEYLGNATVFQPAQLVGKVILQYSTGSETDGSVSKQYEVRDISELEIDGDSNRENLKIIDELAWCPLCGEGTASHIPHFLDKHKDSSVSFATLQADATTDVEPYLPLLPGLLEAPETAVVTLPEKKAVESLPPIRGVLDKVVDAVEKEDSRHAGALDELRKDVNAMQQLEAQNVEVLKEKIREDKIEQERLLQEQKDLQTQLDLEKSERANNALQNSEKIDALKLEYQQEIATLKTDTARNLKDFESSIEALKLNYESKIGTLTNEKDALTREIVTLKDTIASLQGEIAQKKDELEQGKQELERLKQNETLQAKDTDTLKQEKEVIGQEIAALGTQKTEMEHALADLQREMADVTARLKKHLLENKTEEGIIKLHTEVEKMIEEEMGMDGLIDLLQKKQYVEFKARVQKKDVIKEKHSLPAQFLNCESIAATWRLFEKTNAVSPVMAQKLMHHIRLYDSMEYDDSLHRFTSRYFKKFEATLGYAAVTNVPEPVATDGAENLIPSEVKDVNF